ncbi:putative ABC-type transport system, periplasmic component/surface lipoprotein [Synechococcus sp. PCC 7502]|uniref:BMP family ABC transporter substrate-binding protein n=1 Tax=Synechococcus sp. PCC 7502 TaxID=1173263 RepID=UPI00029FDE16|nr:BMP family ABC transporter substrate-binding protein [Synechococcus sp. PCC 7502]AFY73823.1 putative ABC-type transport system, periplasmic component/surface lipoprotein [Synechococcus sp. PCC 7502]
MKDKEPFFIPRRQVIRGILASTAFGVTSQLWTGCTSTETPSTTTTPTASTTPDLTIGFIFVGPKDDFGYNQSHFQGEGVISKLPGIKTVDEANVPETATVQETMLSMINQNGATLLFPTSFGYFDPHILKIAKENPKVQFLHCGGLYKDGVHPPNVGSYYGYIDEAEYIAGIVAGLTTKSGKLGFVAAKPIPQVLRNINSYTLGARSVNPKATVQVIFTGDWSIPVKEAEAANSMVDQGVDVMTCHVDSPKVVIETAEKRKIFSTGYHVDQSQLAPNGFLTGSEWDWGTVYTKYVDEVKAGKTLADGGIPHLVRGGLKEKFCKLSPYGAAVSAATKKEADAALAKFMDGTQIIYAGEIKDNTGKVVIPKGVKLEQTNPKLEQMDWLVEGVVGKIG